MGLNDANHDLHRGLTENLGQNVRFIRDRRSLTQGQLAKLSGIPRSTVANLETGRCNPTLSVLSRLAAALHLSLEELLSEPRAACQLFPRGSLPERTHGKGKEVVLVRKLLPHPIPGMEIDRLELQPGARMIGTPHRPGTHEYLYCESGSISLSVAGETFDLRAGDVAAFPGDQKHSYLNTGSRNSGGFSVVTLAPVRP